MLAYPSGANSIASSGHSHGHASDAAAANGLASRSGQGQGQLATPGGHAGASLAAGAASGSSGADRCQQPGSVCADQLGAGMSTVTGPAGVGHQSFAVEPKVGMQNQSGVPGADAAQTGGFGEDHAADGALPQAGRGPRSGPGQSQVGSHSAGSVQTAADVKLSSVQSIGCSSSGQPSSQRQVPLGSDQAVPAGAGLAQAPGQQPAALLGIEVEQRSVEEQEVLYNMTGQTGSLMYMAPEVDPSSSPLLAVTHML